MPFYEKAEVKSIGHRHTIDHDTADQDEIKQLLLKLSEMVARRLRAKNLLGKTIHVWYRKSNFEGLGMQKTIIHTNDGLNISKTAWGIFWEIWDKKEIRMLGISISKLKSELPQNLNLFLNKQTVLTALLDKINDKYGEFTLQRGVLLTSPKMTRKPNPFLSDRRFKL